MNETDQFLQETENILEQPLNDSTESTEETTNEGFSEETEKEAEQRLRNRREKRLVDKLQAERESSIALAARLEAITEAKRESEGDDYLKGIERIYGTDTPEAAAATDLLRNALKGVAEQSKESALATFREEQRQAAEAVRAEEGTLDTMIEELEDEYGVTLTQDQQRSYFRLLEKLSPKDRDGNVVNYADHHAVYEEWQERLKKPRDTRAKDLVSRGMTRSGSGAETKVDQSAEEKFLKEHDII